MVEVGCLAYLKKNGRTPNNIRNFDISTELILAFVFVGLTIIGVPLFVSVGLTTALALLFIDIPFTLLAQTGYGSLTPFPLLTIPLFVLAGRLMEVGGMAHRMISIATNLVGAYRGSMGLVTVFACMLFAALSGSGPATTAAIGSVTVPAMKRENYDVPFAAAITASAGALGSLIPPSNLLIIYGLVSETSIPRLFLAGLIPGIMVTILLMITTYIIARRRHYGGDGKPFSFRPFLQATWAGKWSIAAPVLILGGIYGGVFTPTEAAGVAVFYALFVGLFIYRELTIKKIIAALRFTALLTGILILLTPTLAFGQLTAFYDVPTSVQEGIMSVTTNAVLVLLLIGAFYIFIGTFMESLAQIVLFTAVFLPLVTSLGVDPVMFGIFTVITCEIGFLTPPLGANLTVAARISGISIERISVAVLPFILAYIIGMIILVFSPDIATFLPNWLYGEAK
ncbi:MAG: TRAP transporter large permease [Aestuariivita sp.]|nr:TRAP transporter large permease [Aestuariivita sp.]